MKAHSAKAPKPKHVEDYWCEREKAIMAEAVSDTGETLGTKLLASGDSVPVHSVQKETG